MTRARTTPAARLDELTRLYERHAYVVWNVALRTTLDDEAAGSAARRAFAAQVQHPDERRLALDAARLALDATAGGVDARGVDDPVLAATAHLAAVQRAVLALSELTDLSPATVAEKLGIESERERQLREGASEQLGRLLGVTGEQARAAYEDVPWLEPPAELWQALYLELHEAVTERAQAGNEPAQVAAVQAEKKPARTRGVRRLRSGALAAIAALAVAGVAWAATSGSDSNGSDPGAQSYLGATTDPSAGEDETAQSGADLLTPEELDALRRKEIVELKRFQRRKENRSLPQRERDKAARKVSDLVKLAQARQRAAEERELALRRQLAREREARYRERDQRKEQPDKDPAPTSEQRPTQEQSDGKEPAGGQKTGGGGGSGDEDRDPVETKCLYDPDNGTYICPE